MDQATWDYLMALPKEFKHPTTKINISNSVIRHILISPTDKTQEFLLECKKSANMDWKISLHHQENNNIFHLIRVDYNGGHKNPDRINQHIPNFLRPYRDVQINESHIHINVEGYRDLAWAIPLSVYDADMPVEITDWEDYGKAIIQLTKKINLTCKLL
jgi:hypothetical protein